jgi:hypothetical protein
MLLTDLITELVPETANEMALGTARSQNPAAFSYKNTPESHQLKEKKGN